MLLNLLHLQTEQWQDLRRAAILACGVEIHTAVLQTVALGLTSWIYSHMPTKLMKFLLHDGLVCKISRLLSCATKQ